MEALTTIETIHGQWVLDSTRMEHSNPQSSNPTLVKLRAIKAELEKIAQYPALSCEHTTLAGLDVTYLTGATILEKCEFPELRSTGLWALARIMNDSASTRLVSLKGSECRANCVEIYREALRCCQTNVLVYVSLGATLSGDSAVVLTDSRVFNKRRCFLEAIRIDPTCPHPYFNLANILVGNETVALPGGSLLNKRQLYVEALRYDPSASDVMYNLGSCLDIHEKVILPVVGAVGKRELFLQSQAAAPNNAYPYYGLSDLVSLDETIEFSSGLRLTGRQLILESMRLGPNLPFVRNRLRTMAALGSWTYRTHSQYGAATNRLFAVLFLSLQRLETEGGLVPVHHSMLEEMLEAWTWKDAIDFSTWSK